MNINPNKSDVYLDLISKSFAPSDSESCTGLDVSRLIETCGSLRLRLLTGKAGLSNRICFPRSQLLGLALAGRSENMEKGSVQILGQAELSYMREHQIFERAKTAAPLFKKELACFLTPNDLEPPAAFLRRAKRARIPVLVSPLSRSECETQIQRFLEEELAPSTAFHGDLVVFCGLGLLILGKSGIGKSDCALDLITHGHQLVADDIVHVRRNPLGQLIGRARDLIRYHMDIRGLGIINVKELFSVYSVIEEHSIDLVLFLEAWNPEKLYSCFQEEEPLQILGVKKPLIRLPVAPGRNWTNLIQVAVRNFILRSKGHDSEKDLREKLAQRIKRQEGSC